jgi:hypothetical protein
MVQTPNKTKESASMTPRKMNTLMLSKTLLKKWVRMAMERENSVKEAEQNERKADGKPLTPDLLEQWTVPTLLDMSNFNTLVWLLKGSPNLRLLI